MRCYTTRDVSELAGLSQARVRNFARRGLLSPVRDARSHYQFGFQDMVLMRTARALIDAEVSPRKSFRLLMKLKTEFESTKQLSAVKIYADGSSNVLVQENQHIWNAETGQGYMNFQNAGFPLSESSTSRSKSGDIAHFPANRAQGAGKHPVEVLDLEDLDSDDWYNLALDLEDIDPQRAPEAYRRAIELNPKNADALVNLGRLYQLQGDIKRAKQQYQAALHWVKGHQLAAYNLGTLFDELDELDTAIEYYCEAPTVPDSHYNLSRIFEARGDQVTARRHMSCYERMLESLLGLE